MQRRTPAGAVSRRIITVDAFASESNAQTPRFCSRLHEPGAEAINALCVLDWSRSECPAGGAVHGKITTASARLCLLSGGGQGDAMEENRGSLLFCTFRTSNGWPSRAGARAARTLLHSTSSRRARAAAAGVRCCPRPTSLLPGPGCTGRALRLVKQSSASSGVCVGQLGPLRRPPRSSCLPTLWDGGGRVPFPGLHSDGPSPWGLRGDVSSPRPSCARGAALVAHSYHPSWDKQE